MKKNVKKAKRLEKLKKLEERWIDCQRCILKDVRKNVVLWRGHPCAKVFIVGEAPGETEDIKGEPFVGASGIELDSMLVDCGVRLHRDIFVANILGCRPPNNNFSKIEPKHIKKCRPRLERMINIVKPKVILLMGGSAAKHLSGITSIGQWKGKETTVEVLKGDDSYLAIPTYHPSYYLRTGKNKKVRKEIISHIKIALDLS